MTLTSCQPTIRRGLLSRPLPSSEPPYDEVGAGDRSVAATVQGTLALAFVLPGGMPAHPGAPPDLRLVPPLVGRDRATWPAPENALDPDADLELDLAEFGPQPTASDALPEPRGWAGQFTQALVEVLAGDRPLSQLIRWTSGPVYDDVVAMLPAAGRHRAGEARGVVRSVHVSRPGDGVAEVAVLVRRGARSTAVALRLEGLDGRWQCTALEVG